jgi:RHS repeat-associated protein
LGKTETHGDARAIVDKAVGELAELNARLGRYDRLEKLFGELGNREISGPATEKLTGEREGLSIMRNQPGIAFRCGPMALDRVRAAANPADAFDPKLTEAQSTRRGLSLANLMALANELGMNYQMAYRAAGAEVITSAVVHWKAGHFAALTKAAITSAQSQQRLASGARPTAADKPRFLVQDPTFGEDIWVSQKALDAEASGYFLIANGKLPAGWRTVTPKEGRTVWGKGTTTSSDPEFQTPCDDKVHGACSPCNGMAEWNFHTMLIALNIVDTPVGYTPPRGPAVNFTVTYNERDSFQPALFSYWNLGPKWTNDWLSYITDDPSNPAADAKLYVRGGGQETYTGFNAGTQQYGTQLRSRSVLARISSTSYERRMPDGSKQVFSQPDGATTFPRKIFMTQVVDPMGNAVVLTYDSSLRLTAITDAIGQVTMLSYQDATKPLMLTKVTDPFGRFATFQYSFGKLNKITDVINLESQFPTYLGDFIAAMTTPYGTTTFSRPPGQPGDATNRKIQATDPLNDTEKLEFRQGVAAIPDSDPANTVPAGMATHNTFLKGRNSFYWDKQAFALGQNDYTKAKLTHWLHSINQTMAAGVKESEKLPLERRVWYNYQNQGNSAILSGSALLTKVGRVLDDGTTQLYQYQYNDLGGVIEATDPLGRRTTYVYAANGIDLLEVRQTTGSANDLLNAYTYNSQHEPLTSTDAARQNTTYVYNAQGQPLTVTNAKNEPTTYAYDTSGYLQSVTGPVSGAVTTYGYDGFGRVRTVIDSDGYVVTTDYDALDRPTVITYPDATFQQVAYDKLDVSQTRDRLGRITEIEHDAVRRVMSVTDPLTRKTSFGWCKCGALASMTDALMHTTTWNRDLQGRLTSKVLADNTHADYVYETTTSRLKQMTDAKNQVTNYQYFGDDNLKQVSYTNATIATPTVNYTYETTYNRIATMADGTGTTTYAYHPVVALPSPPQLGATQLASVDGPLSNDTITYGYDELGRVLNRAINAVASSQVYDTLGRVMSATNPLGAFGYTYEGTTNRMSTMQYPNGQNTTMTYYDNLGDHRLQVIRNDEAAGSVVVSQFTYGYLAEGEIDSQIKEIPDPTNRGTNFTYDAAGQLTRAVTLTTHRDYSYDSAGNRTQEVFGSGQFGGSTTNFVYNSNTNVVTSSNGSVNATFSHDLNGSLTGDGARTFQWDGANRLVAVIVGTHRSEFSYDGIGRRTRIVEKDNSLVTSDKRYVWCGGEICEERDGTGSTVQKRFYDQGVQEGATNFLYTRDHLGSIREKSNSAGTVVARYDYDPWGRQTVLAGSAQDAVFGYAGYFVHQPSGLNLTWYRAYDPNLARWISRDPIGEDGGLNVYDFVQNNPVNYLDPDGSRTFVCCRRLLSFPGNITPCKHCYILVMPGTRAPSANGSSGGNGGGPGDRTYGLHDSPPRRKGDQGPIQNEGSDKVHNGSKDCKEVSNWNDASEKVLGACSANSACCRGCGKNYSRGGPNSNTYVHDVLECAGMTPPELHVFCAPGYKGPKNTSCR